MKLPRWSKTCEYRILAQADGDNGTLNAKDRRWLSPLTQAEAKRFLSTREGVAWAEVLIGKLPDLWRRNPFLLESALQVAEANEGLRTGDDLAELTLPTKL